jgi:tight adherence protein C
MNGSQIAFLMVVFLFGRMAVAALLTLSPVALRERLTEVVEPAEAAPDPAAGGWSRKWRRRRSRFRDCRCRRSGWERSPLRTRFMNAGWRSASAPPLYFAAKTLLAIGLPAIAALWVFTVGAQQKGFMYLLLLVAGIGYYLPNAVLAHKAAALPRYLRNLPDALDLLTVCVEAGLSSARAGQGGRRNPHQERGAGAGAATGADGDARRLHQGARCATCLAAAWKMWIRWWRC